VSAARTLPVLLDTNELAALLRCSANAVVQRVRRGRSPPVYGKASKGLLLFREDDVIAFLQRGQAHGEQVPGSDGAGERVVPAEERGAPSQDGQNARGLPQGDSPGRRSSSGTPRERALRVAREAKQKRAGKKAAW
jgi:hypothetical protein